MSKIVAVVVLLLTISTIGAWGMAYAADYQTKPYYVKVEVKGDLVVAPDYKFEPKPDFSRGQETGASVKSPDTFRFQLVVSDKTQYDFAKVNAGKRVIVSGELESFVVLPPFGARDQHSTSFLFIRVSEIRLADQK